MASGKTSIAVLAVLCLVVGFVGGFYGEEMVEDDDLFGDDDDDCSKAGRGEAIVEAEHSLDIDPDDFVEGVDHQFYPLTPGTTLIYEGQTEDGLERVEVTTTDETKEIMGVDCVVVRDTVTVDGELVEDTYDWFAQDAAGNVWYFGEESKELDDGEWVLEGSWEAGVDGALPGIIMLANPIPGVFYRQEYYPGEAEDMGGVIDLDGSAKVPYGDFDDLLVTWDYNPMEPDVVEYKYYAEGIGVVLEVENNGDSERVELIDIEYDEGE